MPLYYKPSHLNRMIAPFFRLKRIKSIHVHLHKRKIVVSRILSKRMTIYLASLLPVMSLRLFAHIKKDMCDAVLHFDKDLAVSFPYHYGTHLVAKGMMLYSVMRFCSHLVDHSRRALPATIRHVVKRHVSVRTFLSVELSSHDLSFIPMNKRCRSLHYIP